MKKAFVLLTLVVATLLTTECHSQQATLSPSCTTNRVMQEEVYNKSVPDNIELIFSSCKKMERIGELPNGDIVFMVSGLPVYRPQKDNLSVGVKASPAPSDTTELLILKSKMFQTWVVLAANPSETYVMNPSIITANWTIEVIFKKGADTVKGYYDFKEGKITFLSQADEKKISPIPEVDMN